MGINMTRRGFVLLSGAAILAVTGCSSSTAGDSGQGAPSDEEMVLPSRDRAIEIIRSYSVGVSDLVALEDNQCYVVDDGGAGLRIGACEKNTFICSDETARPVYLVPMNSIHGYDSDEEYLNYPDEELPGELFCLYPESYDTQVNVGMRTLFNEGAPDTTVAQTLDRPSGEKLITFQSREKHIFLSITGGWYGDHEEPSAMDVFEGVEEADGVQIDGDYEAGIAAVKASGIRYGKMVDIDNATNVFYSSEPTSFTVGRYEGTDFIEETIDLDCYYITLGAPVYECPVIKTKNGYFEIDCSDVPAGTYVMDWNAIINIV